MGNRLEIQPALIRFVLQTTRPWVLSIPAASTSSQVTLVKTELFHAKHVFLNVFNCRSMSEKRNIRQSDVKISYQAEYT